MLSRKIAFTCYLIIGVVSVLFGLVYLFRSEFMPYHSQAIGMRWEMLAPHLQILMLGFVRMGGAGMLTTGLTVIILLLIPFRRGEVWVLWALPTLCFLFHVPIFLATLNINNNTPAESPWLVSMLLLILCVIGCIASWIGQSVIARSVTADS